MLKKIVTLTMSMFMLLTFCNSAFALNLEDLESFDSSAGQNIYKNTDFATGALTDISYVISSTGATSGIRYRTSAITVSIGGQTATIDISSLVGHAPSGTQLYSLITVSVGDILSAIPNPNSPEVIQALKNPSSIQIGANIQIYNAGTGEVLATITNRDDVAPIASSIGFGSQDISDMQSRFLGDTYTPVILPEEPDNSGLRPSILVK